MITEEMVDYICANCHGAGCQSCRYYGGAKMLVRISTEEDAKQRAQELGVYGPDLVREVEEWEDGVVNVWWEDGRCETLLR